jgi:transposase
MYLNGMGLREIERVTEIHHTTIINWIRQTGISQTGIRIKLSNSQKAKKISERNEIDDLHAFLRHFFISLSPIKNYLNSYLNRYNSAISSFFI